MSYNFADRRVASEARDGLAQKVTDARRTASPDEYGFVELSGQILHAHLENVNDEHLVEYQAYGSCVPSTGTSNFFINCTVTPIRSGTGGTTPAVRAWDPSQGPLAISGPINTSAAVGAGTASSSGARTNGGIGAPNVGTGAATQPVPGGTSSGTGQR